MKKYILMLIQKDIDAMDRQIHFAKSRISDGRYEREGNMKLVEKFEVHKLQAEKHREKFLEKIGK